MQKLRVLHLIDSGGIYGAERVILNLSNEQRKGGAVTPVVGCLVSSEDEVSDLYQAALDAGVEAIRLRASNHLLWLHLPRLARLLRRERIGLIHAHGYKPAVFAFFFRWLAGITPVSTCHLWYKPESGPIKMRLMVSLEKKLYRWFPKVLVVSEDIRKTLISAGVPAHRVEVIPNGVQPKQQVLSAMEREELRRSIGVERDDFCVINPARLTAQKAQWILVEAAARLKQGGRPCTFLLVGDGELQSELREKIGRLGVELQVRMTGFRRDIGKLMAASDAFVLTSLDEGMPMSLLEAVAADVPVVTTPVGDITKLIEHARTGLLVPVGDVDAVVMALDWLRSHRVEASEMAAHAKQRLLNCYSCEAMASRYEAVYDEVVGRRA